MLLSSIGTSGDVNPFIAVGRALAGRGHDVTALVEPRYRQRVEHAGLACRTLADDGTAMTPSSASRSAVDRSRDVFRDLARALPEHLDAATAAMRDVDPDLVLCHHIALATAWAAEREGRPWAMAALAPASWPSAVEPTVYPGMPDLDRYPPLMLRLSMWAGRAAVSAALDPRLNRVRRRHGLVPRRRHLVERMFDGVLNLGLWSPSFRPPAVDDPPGATICGFTWTDGTIDGAIDGAIDGTRGATTDTDDVASALPPTLARFLDAGPPPVVVTLGTSVALPERLRAAAIAACRRLDHRLVLLAGAGSAAVVDGPVGAWPFAPHHLVMPRARAIVHHGGMGTTAQALRAGRPMVVIPFAHDQFDNAARCRRLGVSRTLPRRRASASALARALTAQLEDEVVARRAAGIAATLRDEDGAEAAARTLEEVMQSPGGIA